MAIDATVGIVLDPIIIFSSLRLLIKCRFMQTYKKRDFDKIWIGRAMPRRSRRKSCCEVVFP